jgi:hypothetical protein
MTRDCRSIGTSSGEVSGFREEAFRCLAIASAHSDGLKSRENDQL